MEDKKVWCEDCHWHTTEWVFHRCKNKINRTYVHDYPGPYVARPVEILGDYARCTDFNKRGDCPQYREKQPLLIQIKEFFNGRT